MRAEERAAAIAAYRRLLESWNNRNAQAYAEVFAANAHVTGFDGSQMNGRPEIVAEMERIFADHPTAAYVAKVREVRALADGVILIRAVAGMIPPGKDAINAATNAIQSVIVTSSASRDEAHVEFFQNTPAAFHGRPDLSNALTEELTNVLESGEVLDAD